MTVKDKIICGHTSLGIELGSTRIKAVLIDASFAPVASGSHTWENRFENGCWTYSLEDIHTGIQSCYADLAKNVYEQYGVFLETVGSMGISAMMHGYMAFDKEDNLLTPFRTWRNTTTEQAANELTALFKFNIPQRWSVSHLYQAVLNNEEHLSKLAYVNTLAGYIHKRLTGRYEVGIGEASGIFPVDGKDYNNGYMTLLNEKLTDKGFNIPAHKLFPKVRLAGEKDAVLTEEGAKFLDPTGRLKPGIPVCPPEGDAGTGMTATNSVRAGTGNVSAGTSIFAMLALDKPLKGYYPEVDMVTTPDGSPVAMVHCNNCCGELDRWVNVFGEFASLCGCSSDKTNLYNLLYSNAMSSSPDCDGITAYNYISGEPVTGLEKGKPMYFSKGERDFTLGGFFRAQLYSSMAALKIGMDILFEKEYVKADKFTGHGGLFKVEGVAQQILADGLRTDVSVMKTAGEGGAWGMALLAAYMNEENITLSDFLDRKVFSNMEFSTLSPTNDGAQGFDKFIKSYKSGLTAQKIVSEI